MTALAAAQAASILRREWLLVLPVLALLLAPGWGFAYAFARRERLSWPWVVSLAYSWGVAWCSVLAIAAFYLHLSLSFVEWGYLAALPFSAYLTWRTARHAHRTGAKRMPLLLEAPVLGIAALVTAMLQQPWWFGSADSFFHLAAARSLLATGRPIVTDPMFGTASSVPDSTAGMWNTVMAVVARVLGTDVATVFPALTAFSAFVVVISFWVLAREGSRSRVAASAATVAYVVAVWYTDFRAFGNPNKISVALALTGVALLVHLASRQDWTLVIAAGITGLSALAVHLAPGELFVLAGGAIAVVLGVFWLVRRRRKAGAGFRAGALAVLGGIGLSVLLELPTLYPRVTALEGTTVLGQDSFTLAGGDLVAGPLGIRYVVPGAFGFGGPWLFWLTLAVAGVALLVAVRTDSRRTLAVAAALLLAPTLTLFLPISTPALCFSSYMVARMVDLLRFTPYLALAWAWGSLPRTRVRVPARALGAALVVAALVTQWPFILSTYVQGEGAKRHGYIYSVAVSQQEDLRKRWGFDAIFEMRKLFGDSYPVVLADPFTGYHLAGLETVASVATLPTHTPVFLTPEEAATRSDEATAFFDPKTTEQERLAIVKRYHVRYVFVWMYMDGLETTNQLKATPWLKVVLENKSVVLLEVTE